MGLILDFKGLSIWCTSCHRLSEKICALEWSSIFGLTKIFQSGNDDTGNGISEAASVPSQDEIEAKLEEMETGKRPQVVTSSENKPEIDDEVKTEIEQSVRSVKCVFKLFVQKCASKNTCIVKYLLKCLVSELRLFLSNRTFSRHEEVYAKYI